MSKEVGLVYWLWSQYNKNSSPWASEDQKQRSMGQTRQQLIWPGNAYWKSKAVCWTRAHLKGGGEYSQEHGPRREKQNVFVWENICLEDKVACKTDLGLVPSVLLILAYNGRLGK